MPKAKTLTVTHKVRVTPAMDTRLRKVASSFEDVYGEPTPVPVATVIRLLVRQSLIIGLHHTITDQEYYRDSESIMKFLETNK